MTSLAYATLFTVTQVGDRLKALKSLLKSGDTKSIIYYAGVSRSRDIYILAANYLQNLDWHDDPQVRRETDRNNDRNNKK